MRRLLRGVARWNEIRESFQRYRLRVLRPQLNLEAIPGMKTGPPKGTANEQGPPAGSRRDEPVMDAPEALSYLHIHKSTLYRLVKRSEIPYFRMGYRYRFNREQLDEWRMNSGEPR
jgi:excisionase family DNA binding protein